MFETLAGFLSGYLHQDWDTEYSGALDAAQDFGRTGALERVAQAIGEITVLLQTYEDEVDIEKFLVTAGCYYRPNDSTLREWLELLSKEMVQQASHRSAAP